MYYRNKTDITTDQGVEVDAGSLWKLDEKTFIVTLVDEDQHLTAKHTVEVFEYVVKEYRMDIYNFLDASRIRIALIKDMIAFSLTGNKNTDKMNFQFKTLLRFSELEKILKSIKIDCVNLTAMDEDNY